MRAKLPIIFLLTYIIISLMQLVASLDGIMHFFHLHWIFAGFAALLLIFIPAIGPLAGVYGAVAVWGWHPLAAIILFFWPYIFYGILALFGLTGGIVLWHKSKKMYPQQDIEPDFTVKETKNAESEDPTLYIRYRDKDDN